MLFVLSFAASSAAVHMKLAPRAAAASTAFVDLDHRLFASDDEAPPPSPPPPASASFAFAAPPPASGSSSPRIFLALCSMNSSTSCFPSRSNSFLRSAMSSCRSRPNVTS